LQRGLKGILTQRAERKEVATASLHVAVKKTVSSPISVIQPLEDFEVDWWCFWEN
jgi:hypothetical protein